MNYISQFLWTTFGKAFELALEDIYFELGDVSAGEGVLEGDHLIEQAAQRPHIGGSGVRAFHPDFGTGVERSAHFGAGHSVSAY